MKKKQTQLNDGYASFYKEKEKKTDFNAAISAKTKEDMEYIVDMAYQECYKRDKDFEFAEMHEHALSLKVKMHMYSGIKKEYKVVIEGIKYNILKIDYAKSEERMYLYLEEVGKFADAD